MIVHIFPQEKFTEAFIKFINENFNINNHMFFIHGENNTYNKKNLKNINNIKYINNKKDIFILSKYIIKSKKIILHSFFIPKYIQLVLALNKKILKKCNWVIWGGDLYYEREDNLKSYLREYIKKRILKNIGGCITHIKGDYDLAKKIYNIKGDYLYSFMYPSNLYKEYNFKYKKTNNDKIYIQVGNSADPTNNHIEILDKLKEYYNYNIEIICPLSYGDIKNREEVVKYGNNIFGKRFRAIVDFVQLEEYLDILSKIDIAIFNHKRQQAIGNITTLIGFGKKVYIRDDITTWDFCKQHNLKVFNISKKCNILKSISEQDKISNMYYVKENFSENKLINDLKYIFTKV